MKRAVLISDLHLSVGPDHNVEDFFSDQAFRRFLHDPLLVAAERDEIDLVLLGDTFDLWKTALDDAEYQATSSAAIPVSYTPEDEVRRLERARQGHPLFFAALQDFCGRRNARVTIIPGNHDHSLVEQHLQAALHSRLGPQVRFALNFDRPDLALYAEHGNQWDGNNEYQDFVAFGVDAECAGYFFVRLFWSRLVTLEPRLATPPQQWTQLWHFLMPVLRHHPLVLAQALRFWWQYRRDPRVPRLVGLASFAPVPNGAPELAGAVARDGPDLLAAGATRGGHVFADDPEIEHALRQAYHTAPEVRQAVDELRPAQAPPVPAPEGELAAAAFSFAPSAGLAEKDGAEALFRQNPTGRDTPLDEQTYRWVLFGHTHRVGEAELSNGAWYINTGTWIGREPQELPVVIAERQGDAVRAALARFVEGRIEVADEAWHH